MRGAGILLPVFSLPGKYGIGSFGKEAYKFIDFLTDCGQHYWQVLPLGPTSIGDSPYQSPSVYAGNPYFIDLDILCAEGLITEEECRQNENASHAIDYSWLYQTRYPLLRTAFSRFNSGNYDDYESFRLSNAQWLDDYALFMAVKGINGNKSLAEWPAACKRYQDQSALRQTYDREMRFWVFLQYLFFRQWYAVKEYANARGIGIIGDKPIYTAYDSVELWSNPQYFQVHKDLTPIRVSGCPPDGFTADGQLWGNPLYDWDRLKKDNYEWLLKTYDSATRMFDFVRIDHFRGFSSYYSVPYGEKTARNGEWVKGPGKDFISVLKSRYVKDCIIAEDLGYKDDDVIELLKFSGYPGMKLLQFALDKEDSDDLPEKNPENSIAYLGTHDNTTGRQWLGGLSKDEKKLMLKAVKPRLGENLLDACLRCVLGTKSQIAVIMMFDYMKLGAEARINKPSTLGRNWTWRANKYNRPSIRRKIKRLTKKSGR